MTSQFYSAAAFAVAFRFTGNLEVILIAVMGMLQRRRELRTVAAAH